MFVERLLKKAPDGIHSVKGLTMTYMSLLLKTANHLALLLPEYTNVKTQSEYSGDICREVLASHPEFVQHSHTVSLSVLSQPKYCGKMKVGGVLDYKVGRFCLIFQVT